MLTRFVYRAFALFFFLCAWALFAIAFGTPAALLLQVEGFHLSDLVLALWAGFLGLMARYCGGSAWRSARYS